MSVRIVLIVGEEVLSVKCMDIEGGKGLIILEDPVSIHAGEQLVDPGVLLEQLRLVQKPKPILVP